MPHSDVSFCKHVCFFMLGALTGQLLYARHSLGLLKGIPDQEKGEFFVLMALIFQSQDRNQQN